MTAVVAPTQRPGTRNDTISALRDALRPEFLREAGWNPAHQILAPPRAHPLLGMPQCPIVGCTAGVYSAKAMFCLVCHRRYRKSELSLAEFLSIPLEGKPNRGEKFCIVADCERPAYVNSGVCVSHYAARRTRFRDLSVHDWITQANPSGFRSWGPCVVASCIRDAAHGSTGLCYPHGERWAAHRRRNGAANTKAAILEWAQSAAPITVDYAVIFKGLPEQMILQILVGIQYRSDNGTRTFLTVVRQVVEAARQAEAQSIFELDIAPRGQKNHVLLAMIASIRTGVHRSVATPESEYTNDLWDLAIFGARGTISFTALHQPWLRRAAKHWVAEDLPLHRGRKAGHGHRSVVGCLNRLSESLRLTRDDNGDDPATLCRKDIVNFLNRLAHLHSTGQISTHTRIKTCRDVRRVLDDVRTFRLAENDSQLPDLPADFTLRKTDIPREPKRGAPCRDIPIPALRAISENLHRLEQSHGIGIRIIAELLIDTGRRPDEICSLPWDCLDRDPAGKHVLVYTDHKNNRVGCRLPISDSTAERIRAYRFGVSARFPGTAGSELMLFPRENRNRNGIHPITAETFTNMHREFINGIADQLTDTDCTLVDPASIVPYSYRHCFAQRHADNGTPPDVLRDLMAHDSMQTTLAYYRVTEKRVRSAIEDVSRHQFDGQGRPVLTAVAGLLADEHTRMRVGQVAVPFGICTEPSNVKAGGHACPYKFTCIGCGHFRSDPSYLPDLKSYLQQLLADRERLLAATDIQDWARAKALPADEEITQLRSLIRRIEHDLDDLTPEDRKTIQDAVNVVRAARQTVNLGMPAIPAT
ncbi:tyrosine-type recombinase/integrase [Mycobacterium sp. THU-M104]|uniref:tyrosine-type recombinase/integrase n=1 Tax=Mycobacterium sp. THU-M104 TaxID=3410515 RepID=UPI003B9A419F